MSATSVMSDDILRTVISKVKKDLKMFFLQMQDDSSPFYLCIRQCVQKFWVEKSVEGQKDWTPTPEWLEIPNMKDVEAHRIIQDEVWPSLRNAQSKLITTESPNYQRFQTLYAYVKEWFSDGLLVDSEWSQVEELENQIKTLKFEYAQQLEKSIKIWENKYSSTEEARQILNQEYHKVNIQKEELQQQNKALESRNRSLENTIKRKNAEISTLTGHITHLNVEVARLKAQVNRLQAEPPKPQSYYLWPGSNFTMQTLLEDLNNLRE